MKIDKRFFIVLIFSLVTACDSNETTPVPPDEPKVETILHVIDSNNGKPITELEYGKPVRFVLELINSTNTRVEFTFSSGKQYDFEVRDVNNQLVWNWAHDQVFIQARTTITLDAGGKIKFTPLWDQKDNKGEQVEPGQYSVTGMIAVPGPEIQKQTFIIEKPVSIDGR